MSNRLNFRWWSRTVAIMICLLGLSFTTPAMAQVKPADTITPQNAYEVRDLLSPGAFYKVQHGMSLKIIPSQRIDWPSPCKEATEKYSQQVRLSADHRSLVGYVAGQPFPLLDTNDPAVATKIVWNSVFKPMWSDDYDLRFYDCDTSYENPGHPEGRQIEYFQIRHYAGYDLVGRTEVEPMPIDPDFKLTGRYWLFGLYPVLAPEEIKGGGFIRYRYADPHKADDIWSYTPTAHRARRLNESIMSSASASGTAAFSWDPEHYAGFNPKVEEYDYKFLAEKNMLGCVHAAHSPEVRCPTDGGTSARPESWEMRNLYLVEAKPRRTGIESNVQALDSRTVIYMDSELWFMPYIDTYDRAGRLWRGHIYYTAFRDRPVPDARVASYPFKRAFVVGATSTDVQSSQSTMCYPPGIETPERECWYINMGAVDRHFFTVEAMTNAAMR
jgi:hypothetical protein